MKMSDIKSSERPRELLLANGPRSLTDTDLLAILLGTGSSRMNVVETARSILAQAGYSLYTLSSMSRDRLESIYGVGPCKYVTLAAAIELGRRIEAEKSAEGITVVNNSQDAYMLVRDSFSSDRKEECIAVFLKRSRRKIAILKISEGSGSMTEMDIKGIVGKALDLKASSVIVSHNHPSGNPTPSAADVKATERLRKALETFEISLLDHIIISDGGMYYSFSDEKFSSVSSGRPKDTSHPCGQ